MTGQPTGSTVSLIRQLVRISAAVAAGSDTSMRTVMEETLEVLKPIDSRAAQAIDEAILQTYLVAGFPRGLNGMRLWRNISGIPAPTVDESSEGGRDQWWSEGEVACSRVYGKSYEKLRENVRELHPALEQWMVLHSYGMVLSRSGLSPKDRELCTIAACAAVGQQRQLHSHLHGALNTGAAPAEVIETFDAIEGLVDSEDLSSFRQLFQRVSKQTTH